MPTDETTSGSGATATAEMPPPTFNHRYRSSKLPSGNYALHDVEIFAAPSGLAKGHPYDRAWLEAALETAKRRKRLGYLAPIHVLHHDEKGQETPEQHRLAEKGELKGGFLDPQRVEERDVVTDKGVERLPTYIADLVEIPPKVFERIRREELPYRSIEVIKPSIPDVSSLALMQTEVPFCRLPLTRTGEPPGPIRFCFRAAGGVDGGEVEAFKAPPPFPPRDEAPAKDAPAPDGAPAKEPPPAKGAPALNPHAVTVLRAALRMLEELIGGSVPDAPTRPAEPDEDDEDEAAEAPQDQDRKEKNAMAQAAVPDVPSYSEAGLEAIARLTAENMKLKTAEKAKPDASRVDEALTGFRAKRLVVDEADFRTQVTKLELRGEAITRFAALIERHLEPLPPVPAEPPALLGASAPAADAAVPPPEAAVSEATRFLAADPELKRFANEEPLRFHEAAAEAARLYDGNEKIRRFFATGSRADFVAARIVQEKHDQKHRVRG